jgi:insulysin
VTLINNRRDAAQQDAEHVKQLTKADMVEFFQTYIKPGSATRAKLSVHLVAQGSAASDEKMTELLKSLNLEKATETKVKASLLRPEMRNDAESLQLYLKTELNLADDKVAAVVAAARDPETGPKVNGVSEDTKTATGSKPVLITDIRSFRASLQATSGAKSKTDLSEYEDLDAKL